MEQSCNIPVGMHSAVMLTEHNVLVTLILILFLNNIASGSSRES